MKTRDEVEALKDNWKHDPCWDIETTEGFDEYYDELITYRKTCELRWKEKHEQHQKDLRSLMCPMSIKWINNGIDDKGFTYQNCITNKCAWWDSDREKCGMIPHTLIEVTEK